MIKYDTIIRALKTFAQAFLGVFVSANFIDLDDTGKTALLISGIAAGVSALMNIDLNNTKTQTKEGE